ncbi:transcription factor EB isoform X7 [Chrysemys picta bellii]|uniref:transcription factor EB isoform X7 n=1 Tax=Chrysemys picta bellii TaxID=8478 RepID=UPI0032B23244
MASRIGLRMQLMREQAQQEEQRERMQQQAVMHYMQQQQMPLAPTPAINTPVQFQSPPSVPGEVLKVQTYLENPTTYHLQKSRDKKVQEYISETYGNKFATHISPIRHSPKPPPAASPGVRPGHVMSSSAGNSAPNSPMAMLNISSNPERELPMSSSHMNVYSGDPQLAASLVAVTSSSCPADLTQKRDLTVERRRRFNINDRIKELGMLIPKANDLDVRWNKGTILKASVDYIRRMQKDLQRSRDLENHSRRLEMTNKQLLIRIQELEMQARLHGLPASSPSGVNVAELVQQVVKQEVTGEDGSMEPQQPQLPPDHETQQQPPLPLLPPSPYQLDFTHGLSFDDGSRGFRDQLDPSHHVSFPSLSKKELDLMLMEDTMLPLASDPLFSAMSPEASKASSRRSSFSMEDADML